MEVVPRDAARATGIDVTEPRYEILPFGKSEAQATEIGTPLRLTITTSPKHGVDRSVDLAVRLRELGHRLTVHMAARMVRGESHLDEILGRAHDAGIDDLFVIGGDAPEPLGRYTSAGDVLGLIAEHRYRPRRLGIAGYPEGHPLIDDATLNTVLEQKAVHADYLVTQLCFEKKALLAWLDGVRARGIDLPLYVGAVGPIERRRLFEISMKIGVGPSLRFLRKQRGLSTLFRKPRDSAARFYDDVAPHVGDERWGIAGFHLFTFNELIATREWYEERRHLQEET
jgi:methylenetetrahydrofolate reductase (NADPH)